MTTQVRRRARAKAPHAHTFWDGSVKIEARRLRMLREWNISTMESVRNAMVMPSSAASAPACAWLTPRK